MIIGLSLNQVAVRNRIKALLFSLILLKMDGGVLTALAEWLYSLIDIKEIGLFNFKPINSLMVLPNDGIKLLVV
ncbi:hypothetical protein ADU60_19605 [Vibrio coralliilyticus]|nr:hypothetical protein DVV14_18505 [Vibrio coralliilyticus]KPH23632.1 hypothetical protein ADU60_19605 [Vibrio coralliilyticus]